MPEAGLCDRTSSIIVLPSSYRHAHDIIWHATPSNPAQRKGKCLASTMQFRPNAPAILAVLRKGVALFYFLSGYQRDGGRFKQRRTRISANAHAVTPCYLSAKVKMLLPEATAIYCRPFSM